MLNGPRLNYCHIVLMVLLTAPSALLASSGGRASGANDGNTGAPGENVTCGTCHGSSLSFSPVQVQIDLTDAMGVPVMSVVSGGTYTFTVTVLHTGSPPGFGFQATVLDEDDNSVGSFSNPSANTQLAQTTGAGGRAYAEHGGGVSATNVFSFDWTAPFGMGIVTVYAAGTAVNNNGTTGGDSASFGDTSSVQLRRLLLFDQRQPFLDTTPADIASAPYTPGNRPAEPLVSGDIAFVSGPMSSLFFSDWPAADFPQDNDIELAINGNEDLDIQTVADPVYALGVDFEDLGGGSEPSTFVVTGLEKDVAVFSFEFDTPAPSRDFLGVWSPVPFDTLSIRETSAANENEFFGTVFTSQTPLPEQPFFLDGFESP